MRLLTKITTYLLIKYYPGIPWSWSWLFSIWWPQSVRWSKRISILKHELWLPESLLWFESHFKWNSELWWPKKYDDPKVFDDPNVTSNWSKNFDHPNDLMLLKSLMIQNSCQMEIWTSMTQKVLIPQSIWWSLLNWDMHFDDPKLFDDSR